jgi:hypothetical protein
MARNRVAGVAGAIRLNNSTVNRRQFGRDCYLGGEPWRLGMATM